MRRVIVGTTGHVDHGKTRLVEALTGTDCDRWEEEKRRGITIDIGFAHLLAGDLQVGFVDVPGHEKFLHNALAGLGGIGVMLLVVAADEGVKPQTREHLAVCDLLGIPGGVVALTKADLVDAEELRERKLQVSELVAGTRFEGCAIVPVSSVSGDGVEALTELLAELGVLHAREVDSRQPVRLPVDRAFLIKGRGLVVTGTLAAGVISEGQELAVVPGEAKARVRGIQVHGEDRPSAEAGERVALQLAGVELPSIERGHQLIAPGSLRISNRWLAECSLLPEAVDAIRATQQVRVHLYSTEVIGTLRPLAGKLEPGASGPVEIRLAEPVAAARGDRLILRRPSPPLTIGGAVVLDPHWRPHRGGALQPALRGLTGDSRQALRLWIEEAGEGGARSADLATRLGWTTVACDEQLAAMATEQQAIPIATGQGDQKRWLTGAAFRRIEQRARKVLAKYFSEHRMQQSMPRAAAVAAILPGRAAELASAHLAWLAQRGVLEVEGNKVALPGRGADLTGGESKLATQILAAYDAAGLTPPPPAEVRAALGAKAQILDGIISHLLEQKKLTRLPGGLLIATTAISRLGNELHAAGQERFTIADFKNRFELTRKWAIPLLEHLDSIGTTRRVGNERQLIQRSPTDAH